MTEDQLAQLHVRLALDWDTPFCSAPRDKWKSLSTPLVRSEAGTAWLADHARYHYATERMGKQAYSDFMHRRFGCPALEKGEEPKPNLKIIQAERSKRRYSWKRP